jgi:hypothetical protein
MRPKSSLPQSRASHGTRRTLLLLLVVVCGGLLALAWRAGRGGPPPLPDGTKVTLKAVTFGRHHVHTAGGFFRTVQGLLAGIPLLDGFGFQPATRFSFDTTNDVVTCWFRIQTRSPHDRPVHHARILEAPVAMASRATAYKTFPVTTNETVWAVTFANYPRSQRKLLIELLSWKYAQGTNWSVASAFRVSNKTRVTKPATAANGLATATSADGLHVVLDQLTGGLPMTNGQTQLVRGSLPMALALFTLRENDQPTTNWRPFQVEGWHPDGNHFRCIGSPIATENGQTGLLFEEALWSTEAPWRLRFTFRRVGNFARADLWTNDVPDVVGTMAASAQDTPLATSTNYHGCKVTLQKLTPAGRPEGGLNLHVRLDRAREDVEATVARVVSETGRPLGFRLSASSRGAALKGYVFELDPGLIHSFQLVLAIHTNRNVEFNSIPDRARP